MDRLNAWESKFKPAVNEAADSLDQYESVMREFAEDRSVRNNPGWRGEAMRSIDRMDAVASDFQNLPDPPSVLASTDSLVRKAGAEMHVACQNGRRVVEEGSDEALKEASQHQQDVTDLIYAAGVEMKRTAGSH